MQLEVEQKPSLRALSFGAILSPSQTYLGLIFASIVILLRIRSIFYMGLYYMDP